MIDYIRSITAAQFDAALAMMDECVRKCPAAHWDSPIGKYPFWHVVYHTLIFTDLYLSRGKRVFRLRKIHPKGWAEYDDEHPSRRFEKAELREYLEFCRGRAREVLAAETRASLQGPSGFGRLRFSHGELHLYNLRHVQHHTGQLSAFLRRVGVDTRWVKTGEMAPR